VNIKLAGAVKHFGMFFLKYKELEKFPFNFTVFDGPNLCKWNGGRINEDITLTKYMVDFYNKNNIGVSLTFSNDIIDTNDKTGNYLLELLDHNPLNGIICCNEELRSYVREKYPEYKITYSITGHSNSIEINKKLIEYYKELESLYDVIVPRFEMGFNPKFYNQINKSKYELMVNDTCVYGCSQFHDHFLKMNELNRNFKEPWKELGYEQCWKIHDCWIKNFNPDVGSEKDREKYGELLGMDFTKDMYKKAINLGYTNFKIMGRENKTEDLKSEIFSHLEKIKEVL